VNALYGCRAVHDGPVCLRSDRWSRRAVCSSCTKGIRHGIEVGRRPALSPRGRGLLALTFGTLLSSQGADAHRYWASRPFSGQLAKRYSAGFAVSNPEVWPHHPHITLGRGIRGVGGMGARPVRRSTGVRGVEHGRRAVAVESNPLSPLSRTAVRCPRRLSSTGAGRARRQAGGGARTRTKPASTAAFHTS